MAGGEGGIAGTVLGLLLIATVWLDRRLRRPSLSPMKARTPEHLDT